MSRPSPIVEYARKIGKNTAEFTASDMARFTRWWIKQPQREDLMKIVSKEKQKRTEQDFRIDMEDKMEQEQTEVICSIGLTQADVESLKWVIELIFEEYNMYGHAYADSLNGIMKALESIEE